MIEASVETYNVSIDRNGELLIINGQQQDIIFQRRKNGLYEAEYRHRLYKLFVHKIDHDKKLVEISINGKKVWVELKDNADRLIERLGLKAAMTKRVEEVRAPMPGLIHSVLVSVEQEITEGQPLVILEAMKMENVIKSPVDAVVSQVLVENHDSVEKNALLLTFK